MKNVIIMNVNESIYCSWSKDFNGYKDFEDEESALRFLKENKLKVKETYSDEELNLILYYVTLEYHNKDLDIEKIFTKERSNDSKAYWDKQERLENERRKNEGYVIVKDFDELTKEDYKGNLNNSLTKDVLEYISKKPAFGYLGHSERKFSYDIIIENVVDKIEIKLDNEKLDKWTLLGIWLTSSDARHWMDNVEDYTDEEFEEEFKESLQDIMLLGFIYGLEEHKGMYEDTIRLEKEYKDRIKIENV